MHKSADHSRRFGHQSYPPSPHLVAFLPWSVQATAGDFLLNRQKTLCSICSTLCAFVQILAPMLGSVWKIAWTSSYADGVHALRTEIPSSRSPWSQSFVNMEAECQYSWLYQILTDSQLAERPGDLPVLRKHQQRSKLLSRFPHQACIVQVPTKPLKW